MLITVPIEQCLKRENDKHVWRMTGRYLLSTARAPTATCTCGTFYDSTA